MRLEHSDARDALDAIRLLEERFEGNTCGLSSIDLDEADLIALLVVHEIDAKESSPTGVEHLLCGVCCYRIRSGELCLSEDGVRDAPVVTDGAPRVVGEREGAGDLIIDVADMSASRADGDVHGESGAFDKTSRAGETGREFLLEIRELLICRYENSSVTAMAVRPLEDERIYFSIFIFLRHDVFDLLYLIWRKMRGEFTEPLRLSDLVLYSLGELCTRVQEMPSIFFRELFDLATVFENEEVDFFILSDF